MSYFVHVNDKEVHFLQQIWTFWKWLRVKERTAVDWKLLIQKKLRSKEPGIKIARTTLGVIFWLFWRHFLFAAKKDVEKRLKSIWLHFDSSLQTDDRLEMTWRFMWLDYDSTRTGHDSPLTRIEKILDDSDSTLLASKGCESDSIKTTQAHHCQ